MIINGQENLGPIEQLSSETLFNQPKQPDQPIRWIQEPEAPDGYFTPVFTIDPLGQKLGAPRPGKGLYPDEKKMIVMAFANDCAEWLFGNRMFIEEVNDKGGIDFSPNPTW